MGEMTGGLVAIFTKWQFIKLE